MDDSSTIRETTPQDAHAVQQVPRVSWYAAQDETMGEKAVEGTVDSWFAPENVVADVNRDERPFFVAKGNHGVVGFVIGVPDEEQEETFHLYRIYVHPDYWGNGVGTQLLERFEEELRKRETQVIRLSVIEPNETAISFCESRGLERSREEADERFDLFAVRHAKQLDWAMVDSINREPSVQEEKQVESGK
ncbi:GNAT family N-acetyltransferase [Haladaptatus caseinilyticus]|uniref:GNAT family N-acetyltransferase n=1 Tax=Haladaptatus caseinilyticus TaxID=2993314 RepID=UPI00224B7B62|nr:GNAT family N-acetyltransferase [Haladaptatus caseinilyticus]